MWYVHALSRKYLFLHNNTVTKYTCVLNCAMGSLKYRYLVLEGIAIKVFYCNCIRFDCVFYLLFLLKSSSCIIKYNAKCRHICIMMGTYRKKKTLPGDNMLKNQFMPIIIKSRYWDIMFTVIQYYLPVYSDELIWLTGDSAHIGPDTGRRRVHVI